MLFTNDIKSIVNDKRSQSLMTIFSIIFGLVKSLSEFVYNNNEINVDLLQSGIYAFICYLLMNFTYYVVIHDYKVKLIGIEYSRKLYWVFFVALILSYIICWLNYWPALISHDDMHIILKNYSKSAEQHPIFYVSWDYLCKIIGLYFGSVLYGVILYISVQILIVASCLSYTCCEIIKIKAPLLIKALEITYLLLTPCFAVFSITMIKDTLWSVAFLMMVLSLYKIYTRNQENDLLMFFVSTFFVTILRNNGIYISLGTTLFILLFYKKLRKKAMVTLGVILVAQTICCFSMKIMGIKQLFMEKASIPLQQISAVVKNDGILSDEQKKFIGNILPLNDIKLNYNPYLVDKIKWGNFTFNTPFLEKNSRDFMNLWFNAALKNPYIYLLAYLQTSYGFWAPTRTGKNWHIYHWNQKQIPLQKFAQVNNLYDNAKISASFKVYLDKYYETGFYIHIGEFTWLLYALILLFYLKHRQVKILVIFVPCILLWITLMIATPAHSFRYILPYAYLLPFFVALLFTENINFNSCNKSNKKDWF